MVGTIATLLRCHTAVRTLRHSVHRHLLRDPNVGQVNRNTGDECRWGGPFCDGVWDRRGGPERYVTTGFLCTRICWHRGAIPEAVRAFGNKHCAMVILKIGKTEDVTKERDINLQLEGIPGIPVIYGWCVTNPTSGYISIQPFTEDLYHYVVANGAMSLRQACEVAGTFMSANV
ncbi:hypothetical protein BDM02DRAFT_2654424 [Thelephora ganbajun]|uniref:Uncharacterized protein n=1 Tax=Thelephora ganbajun TaxID=370292 RepID=A0ACB6ZDQ6_THEGA|nr:hypothetical protein BDM02DRAFT_2654424 [Thelephora ganbajun]